MSMITQVHNLQETINIDGIRVRRDAHGRFCLNDLHHASGDAPKDQPRYFLENKQTQDLIRALTDSGIPLSPVETIRGGSSQGTYAVKEIVYAYAMWISAVFNLKVIRTFDQLVTQSTAQTAMDLNNPELLRQALLGYTEKVIALEHQVQELEPKAQALDQIADTSSAFSLRNAAKLVGVPERKFIQFLLDQAWVYRSKDGQNTICAYSKRLTQKVMTEKVTRLIETSQGPKVFTQALITSKGITRLAAMVRSAGLIDEVAA